MVNEDAAGAPEGAGSGIPESNHEGEFRAGLAAVIGRANVGKSTLVNALVGEKVAITSDKAQTTRSRIIGVVHRPGAQLVLVDTPGLHKPRHRLGRHMVRLTERSLAEVDIVLFVVDGSSARPGPGDRRGAEKIARAGVPVILVVNKMDQLGGLPAGHPTEGADGASGDRASRVVEAYAALGDYEAAVPVSALTGAGLEGLLDEILARLPEGYPFFPSDVVTNQPEQYMMAERIREKVLHLTREEVPHAVAVAVDQVTDTDRGTVVIRATIYVERDSQRKIIIGRRGSMLKQIGTMARQDLEQFLGAPVYLDLWVKVKPDWREREGSLQSLGFRDDMF